MAGQDVSPEVPLLTETAVSGQQETSLSDSHVGSRMATGWQAGTGGHLQGWDWELF
jgi:hypothetical protein